MKACSMQPQRAPYDERRWVHSASWRPKQCRAESLPSLCHMLSCTFLKHRLYPETLWSGVAITFTWTPWFYPTSPRGLIPLSPQESSADSSCVSSNKVFCWKISCSLYFHLNAVHYLHPYGWLQTFSYYVSSLLLHDYGGVSPLTICLFEKYFEYCQVFMLARVSPCIPQSLFSQFLSCLTQSYSSWLPKHSITFVNNQILLPQ